MANLSAKYLGLALKNPLIAGSSGMTGTLQKVVKMEHSGVGAVVLKSLFEEQIFQEANALIDSGSSYSSEASDYLHSYILSSSTQEYLQLIADCKKTVSIPVIASINCVSTSAWINLAREIENAGADAVEINVYYLPDNKMPSAFYEKMYLDIAVKLKKTLKIPFAFKLGSNFTNLIYLVDQLYRRGVSGVVLFNRFYEPDFDIRTLDIKASDPFSSPGDMGPSLRWVSLTTSQVPKIDVAASNGIHSGWDVIKQILAGATVAQVSSALYKNGTEHIYRMLGEIYEWMGKNGFETLDEFRGLVRDRDKENMRSMHRLQYMKYIADKQ